MTVSALRPEDDALDRLASMSHYGGAEFDLRVVREALERHREESEENFQAFMDERDKAVAAEAEVARLKAVIRDEEMEARYAARAEAEVRRLTEGLREYGHHKQGCNQLKSPGLGRSPEFSGQECDCGLAALLSASPSDGGGAKQTHGRGCRCTPCRAEDWDAIDAGLAGGGAK